MRGAPEVIDALIRACGESDNEIEVLEALVVRAGLGWTCEAHAPWNREGEFNPCGRLNYQGEARCGDEACAAERPS